ncbi:TrkH family potassium uptake protein [Thioclava sp.]|uniref:TrkH family potassium uptake protein n=1 Tax=Thioclava sp. TaxID=1933450 RepID=UPI0032423CDE
MSDIRPVLHLFGLILTVLGTTMLVPAAMDFSDLNPNWQEFFEAAVETALIGMVLSLATRTKSANGLNTRQAYLLTAAIWLGLPIFAALPFIEGAPHATWTNAYFEAASGITTTGYTVFEHLDTLPRGVVLWRGMLNWFGGLGIAFVAMIFLPVLRIGGMRYFQAEGFDTLGKVMPRAHNIARSLLWVYVSLTLACAISYAAAGMSSFDAICYAMATIATGGFGTHDTSFASFSPGAQYAGVIFMLGSALPFIRYVQLGRGDLRPFWDDPQIHAFLRWFALALAALLIWLYTHAPDGIEPTFRSAAFNLSSIMTGTGFGTANVANWGSFAMVLAYWVGLIGGCTGSSSGALSVFRWQALGAVIRAAVRRLQMPHRVLQPRLGDKLLEEDVLSSLILYFTGYILTLGLISVGISMTGADFVSALFATWGALGNIGYGVGPLTDRTGTMIDFSDAATWLLTLAMLLGRIGMLAILVVFLPRFWRA